MKRNLVFLSVIVAVLMSFVLVQSPAKAAGTATTTPTSIVVASRLRIRETPSSHAKTVAIVKRGETLTILGKDAARPHWLKVQTAGGLTGWVSVGWVRLARGILLKNLSVVS